jgi:hypothetical protein
MLKPIFADTKHQLVITEYLNLMLSFAQEVSSTSKYEDFKEVMELIIEYHNGYGSGVVKGNWNDWLMIIPINTSVMINGYFAGIKTKRNTDLLRSYRLLLDNCLEKLVEDLKDIEYTNE